MTDQNVFLQKRILDWSRGLPAWQRGLMRKLCDGPLDEAGRAEVLAALCGDPGAALPPLELANLPADETEHGTVELREIRNLRNVNRLAEDQTLRREYQVKRLIESMGQGVKAEDGQLDTLAIEWFAAGPVEAATYSQLLGRFIECRKRGS